MPTFLLNDYLTGYLCAAGALVALARREVEGGSYHLRVSLTRSSMWVQSLGLLAFPDSWQTLEGLRPALQSRASQFGVLEQLGPVAQFSRTSAEWTSPAPMMGCHLPMWAS